MNDGTAPIPGPPGGPGAPAAPRRGLAAALVGVIQVTLLASIVAVPAALWSRLPSRLADHWTFAGTALPGRCWSPRARSPGRWPGSGTLPWCCC